MICRKCKIDKEHDLMINHPNDKLCKICQKEYQEGKFKIYYQKNKQRIIQNAKEYVNNNKKRLKEYKKEYRINNKDKIKQQKLDNKEKYNIKQKEYYHKNKHNIINNTKKYNTKKYKTDTYYRLQLILRCCLNKMLKSKYIVKTKSANKLLGCTIEEYKQHLESQFRPEMSWNNHGQIWEIDHIIPCDSFDLTKEDEQQKCFHYTNLQPLFKTTEIAKSFGYINDVGNRNKSNIYTHTK